MMAVNAFSWKARFRASAIHFSISLLIAALAGALVFGIWYPSPYREISGGRELFLLVVTVDVILGPLITLLVFNRAKPWVVLRRDLGVVALIQLLALGYGLWTVFLARPVHLVFEYQRFRVVHAVEVPPDLLFKAPPNVPAMPLGGPTLLSLRPFRDDQEKMTVTMADLNGTPMAARPDLWQAYANARLDVLKAARPVAELKTRFPEQSSAIDRLLGASVKEPQRMVYLPLVGRKTFWTVFLDPQTAEPMAFMPLDPF